MKREKLITIHWTFLHLLPILPWQSGKLFYLCKYHVIWYTSYYENCQWEFQYFKIVQMMRLFWQLSCLALNYSAACQTVATWTRLVCDNFLRTLFWWLLLQLANQDVRTVGDGVDKPPVGFLTIILSTPPLTVTCILIGQFLRFSPQKVVKKISKSCHRLIKNCLMATVWHAAL